MTTSRSPFLYIMVICLLTSQSPAQVEKSPSPELREYANLCRAAIEKIQRKDLEEALTLSEKAITLNPSRPEAYNLKGSALLHQKKYKEAIPWFEKAGDINPKDRTTSFNIGEAHFLQQHYASALTLFKEFLKANPDHDLAKLKVFLCDLKLENKVTIREVLDSSTPSPKSPLHYYLHAAFEYQASKPEDARDYLRAAGKIYPKSTNATFLDSFIELGWAKAEDVYSTSLIGEEATEDAAFRQFEQKAAADMAAARMGIQVDNTQEALPKKKTEVSSGEIEDSKK